MNVVDLDRSHHKEILLIAEKIQNSIQNPAFFNWTSSVLSEELEKSKGFVYQNEGKVMAFLCYRDLPDVAEIMVLATDLNSQRMGFQTELVQLLQQFAAKSYKSILLEVHALNTSAIQFYKALGFNELHIRKNYYKDGGDAWVLSWSADNVG